MTALATWLQQQLEAQQLTQQAAAVYAGVSGATISDMLNKDHVPRMEILFRLADYFGTPREHVLRLAARMPIGGSEQVDEETFLVEELVDEFRKVPDEWKPEVLAQVRLFVRLANQPPARFVGEDGPPGAVEEDVDENT